jgi:type II secretory pathway component PulK
MNLVPSTQTRPAGHAGVALLAVMCTLTVMILVALAFSNSVQLETRTALYLKEAAQAQAMASGGVEVAVLELAYPRAIGDEDKPRPWPWQNGARETQVPYEDGTALVEIRNETGKVDLNAAGPEQLTRLFEARGLESRAATELAAAIVHWRSPAGSNDWESEALEDYYRLAGYTPRHDRFHSVEEALSVRGMDRDIFYGAAKIGLDGRIRAQYGLGQDLTVYSASPQISVNDASEAALRSVPGVSEYLARAIINERLQGPFKSMDDVGQRLSVSLPDQALPFLTTTSGSAFYSIVSVGEVSRSRVRRTVRVVVQMATQDAARYRTISWYDDAVN